jgi:outer membrane lipoprotein carrier protein
VVHWVRQPTSMQTRSFMLLGRRLAPGRPSATLNRRARFLLIPAGVLTLVAASSTATARSQPQPIQSSRVQPPAADVASALQRRYDTIKDFLADFTQTYVGGTLRQKARGSGTVAIKKPGKMRWDYTSPEKKLFISDGRTFFMHFPADKQVMRNPVPEQDEATSAILFLMGKGDIVRDFNIRYGEGGDESSYVLRLDPRKRQAEYDWLQVTVDRDTLQIRELAWGDDQGGRNSIAFSNFKENAGLADKLFEFTIPRGTEVISSGKSS